MMVPETLLYPGMGYEKGTLELEAFQHYDCIVGVDTLPAKAHYTPEQPGWKFTHDLQALYDKLSEGTDAQTDIDSYPWVFDMNGKFIIYFYNTDYDESFSIDVVHDLWLCGWEPKHYHSNPRNVYRSNTSVYDRNDMRYVATKIYINDESSDDESDEYTSSDDE